MPFPHEEYTEIAQMLICINKALEGKDDRLSDLNKRAVLRLKALLDYIYDENYLKEKHNERLD